MCAHRNNAEISLRTYKNILSKACNTVTLSFSRARNITTDPRSFHHSTRNPLLADFPAPCFATISSQPLTCCWAIQICLFWTFPKMFPLLTFLVGLSFHTWLWMSSHVVTTVCSCFVPFSCQITLSCVWVPSFVCPLIGDGLGVTSVFGFLWIACALDIIARVLWAYCHMLMDDICTLYENTILPILINSPFLLQRGWTTLHS